MATNDNNLFVSIAPLRWKTIDLRAAGKVLCTRTGIDTALAVRSLLHDVADKAPLRFKSRSRIDVVRFVFHLFVCHMCHANATSVG
ncbi:hypothetical protein Enr13x_05290 [Stieleria neptunia]|uniref:Uncharacterized protein n=1 Tax=Stieleria neptunia TaxID=2527979 RepID=A0A518HIK9_9BACT|nr:hypothetical protein Enr13x_05290 [Stieleria neptunia]